MICHKAARPTVGRTNRVYPRAVGASLRVSTGVTFEQYSRTYQGATTLLWDGTAGASKARTSTTVVELNWAARMTKIMTDDPRRDKLLLTRKMQEQSSAAVARIRQAERPRAEPLMRRVRALGERAGAT